MVACRKLLNRGSLSASCRVSRLHVQHTTAAQQNTMQVWRVCGQLCVDTAIQWFNLACRKLLSSGSLSASCSVSRLARHTNNDASGMSLAAG
jgi:hypothetical protein